jgi:hypothetical protein
MGGYNTYLRDPLLRQAGASSCRACTPREEQLIRATRAAELGLIDMLRPEESSRARASLASRAEELCPTGRPPSQAAIPKLRLDGLRKDRPTSSAKELEPGSQKRTHPAVRRLKEATPAVSLPHKIVVLLKGYPRLSETFIAQELRGLERAGLELVLVSLRRPTDKKRHPVHDEIKAPVFYLPEYLHEEPLRVLRGLFKSLRAPGFGAAFRQFLKDLPRDFSRNRFRRFGQAAVLVGEFPEAGGWLHAHFIHTPASVANYAARMLALPFSVSAHAKDIWTSKDWELADKLTIADWAVTCTKSGHAHLQTLAGPHRDRVHLSYHGLDLDRFPPLETGEHAPPGRMRLRPSGRGRRERQCPPTA